MRTPPANVCFDLFVSYDVVVSGDTIVLRMFIDGIAARLRCITHHADNMLQPEPRPRYARLGQELQQAYGPVNWSSSSYVGGNI